MNDEVEGFWMAPGFYATPATAGPGTMGTIEQVTDAEARGLDAGETGNDSAENMANVGDATWRVGDETGASVGVLASAPRKTAHLWKPGQSGNPSGKSKADVAMIRAIAAEFPPEEVTSMVRSAWSSARSSRQQLEVARFIVEYIVGKPKQFVAMSKGSPDDWLRALANVQLPGTEDTEGE